MTSVIRSSLLTRQVHVYMRPAPRSVGQSLLVLEELQKFGEIATFFNFQVWNLHLLVLVAGLWAIYCESPGSPW